MKQVPHARASLAKWIEETLSWVRAHIQASIKSTHRWILRRLEPGRPRALASREVIQAASSAEVDVEPYLRDSIGKLSASDEPSTDPYIALKILAAREPSCSMTLVEFSRKLKAHGALAFGVEAIDIVRSLRASGRIDYEYDRNLDVGIVKLVKPA